MDGGRERENERELAIELESEGDSDRVGMWREREGGIYG